MQFRKKSESNLRKRMANKKCTKVTKYGEQSVKLKNSKKMTYFENTSYREKKKHLN